MYQLKISSQIFNDAYYPYIFDYSHRYQIYKGSAGSGKSHFIAQKLLIKALNDKRKVLVLRKVGRTVKQSVFQLFIDLLVDWKIYQYCKINRTDFTITLPNGSLILATGLDDEEKLKSITGITDAWLEEATQFYQNDFNQIDLRVRHPQAKGQTITLSFNPISKAHWCYSLFFADDENMDDFRQKCFILSTTYKDNPHLPPQYVQSLLRLKQTNPAYYQIYALGEFGSLSKLIYNDWQIAEVAKPAGELCCGLDFGYTNDPNAFVVSFVDDKTRTIYIKEEWFEKGLTNQQIAQGIIKRGYAKDLIIGDSAEQKSIEELKRAGVPRIKPCQKGPGSINAGISELQSYHIIVNPACKNIIEELQNYCWQKDKKTNEYINKPVDKYNHGLDALRYSLQCKKAHIKLLDKSALGL